METTGSASRGMSEGTHSQFSRMDASGMQRKKWMYTHFMRKGFAVYAAKRELWTSLLTQKWLRKSDQAMSQRQVSPLLLTGIVTLAAVLAKPEGHGSLALTETLKSFAVYAAKPGTIRLVLETMAQEYPSLPGVSLHVIEVFSCTGASLQVQEYPSVFRSIHVQDIPLSRSIPPCPEASTMGWTRGR